MGVLKIIWEIMRMILMLPLVIGAIKKSWEIMKSIISKTIVLIFMISCVNELPKFELKEYKKDVKIIVDKMEYNGVAVLEKKKKTDMEFEFWGDVDMMVFTNCHRSIELQNAWSKWWDKRKVKYTYALSELEEKQGCPIHIAGFDRDGKQHSFGMILLNDNPRGIIANLSCNGTTKTSFGVDSCQSRLGTIQKITFPHEVNFDSKSACSDAI